MSLELLVADVESVAVDTTEDDSELVKILVDVAEEEAGSDDEMLDGVEEDSVLVEISL